MSKKLIILGLLKFVQNSPSKPFETCYYCPIIISPDRQLVVQHFHGCERPCRVGETLGIELAHPPLRCTRQNLKKNTYRASHIGSTGRPITTPHQTGTHIPHFLCRESYHLGPHFGTIWGWIGWVLGGYNTVFLVILGLLKFVKNSPALHTLSLIHI